MNPETEFDDDEIDEKDFPSEEEEDDDDDDAELTPEDGGSE